MMTGIDQSSSAQSTINRSKNRLGLLLKQYYDDPALNLGSSSSVDFFSMDRIEKLKTDQVMGKVVESLRSYKEAESELRMLLYNNCDKLLKAVHVVCDIRQGSHELADRASQLSNLMKTTTGISSLQGVSRYEELLAQQSILESIEKLSIFPEKFLRNFEISLEDRVGTYLKLRDELFDPLEKMGLLGHVSSACRRIVEEELVPQLMSDAANGASEVRGSLHAQRASRYGLLTDLFPPEHFRHLEIMQQFVELEIAGIDEKLSTIQSNCQEAVSVLTSLINLLFICTEIGEETFTSKIQDDLIPRASETIISTIGRDKMCGGVEFLKSATSAHLRIPNLSPVALNRFADSALSAWIESQFRSAARSCVTEFLPPLLAASNFGACCDVIHTRCCAVIISVRDALDEDMHAPLDMFAHMVDVYYSLVCRVNFNHPSLGDLTQFLKMVKFIVNRKTYIRTLHALDDIFEVSSEDRPDSVVTQALNRLVCVTVGEWIGHDVEKLKLAINECLVPVLDATVGGVSGPAHARPKELDMAERVHARRLELVYPAGMLGLEFGVFAVTARFLRACREANVEPSVPEFVYTLVGGQKSEFAQTLVTMAKDIVN